MNRATPFWRALALVTATGGALAFATSPAELVGQLDVNGNGQLDNPAEVYLGLYYRKYPGKTDLARIRMDKEVPDAILNAEGLGKDYQKFLKRYGTKTAYRFAEIEQATFAIEKIVHAGPTEAELRMQPYAWEHGLRIRRDASQLNAPAASARAGDAFEDIYDQSAIFTYGRNFNTEIDQWTARGIVAYSLTRADNPYYQVTGPDGKTPVIPARGPLRSLGLDLSVGFDKVNTGGSSAGEVDTLDFGAGVSTSWRVRPDVFRFSGLTASLTGHWATDFDIEKRVVGGTLEVTPTFLLPGYQTFDALLGTYKIARLDEEGRPTTRSYVDFRWWISLHAEAGQVLDAEGEAGLQGYEGFARVGGSANLQIQPFPEALENRLNLYASYLHYEAVTSRTPSSHLFRASLEYLLPWAGGIKNPQNEAGPRTADDITFSLKIEYQNGEIPFVQEKDNSILIGLGILY